MNQISYLQFKIILAVSAVGISLLAYGIGSHIGYKSGKAEAVQEYQENAQKLSTELTGALQKGFEIQQERLNKIQETNHAQIQKTLEEYKALGDCHTSNGIGLLGNEIRKRYSSIGTAK